MGNDTDRIFPRSASAPLPSSQLTQSLTLQYISRKIPPSYQIFQSSPLSTHLRLLTATEIQHQFQPANPRVAEAEAQCRAGDISVLPLLVQKEKTSAQTLLTCLLAAVISGNTRIVQQLLVFGVSVNLSSVRIAITDKALDILSLFVRYGGWDVNREVEWCYPAPLS